MTPTIRTVLHVAAVVYLSSTACMEPAPNEAETPPVLYSLPNTGGPVQITNLSTGQCLEVVGNSMFPYAPVATTPCNGGLNQRWLVRFQPDCLDVARQMVSCNHAELINVNSGLCLDVPGGTVPGLVQQFPCNYGVNQRFVIDTADGQTVIWSYLPSPLYGPPPHAFLTSPGPTKNIRIGYAMADTAGWIWTGLPF